MKIFKLHLGRTAVLVNNDATESKTEEIDHKQEGYMSIAFSKVDTDGDVMEIGMLPSSAASIVEAVKDDPLFELEAHIEVWKYHQEKLYEFDGTLFDALLVIDNEGEQYDV